MSFMMKKKRFKFQITFHLEELSSIPFVSGILFAKIRLLDGGSFTELSSREEVQDHCIKWKSQFSFPCKMSANPNTGILEPCVCRVSIRKELKGGKSFQKLGLVDLNLAEFAGSGSTTRRFLLEGYDSKHRQDNSILKVTIESALLSGDPCFKAPTVEKAVLPGEMLPDLQLENKGEDCSSSSVASGSSGFGSLPRKNRPSIMSADGELEGQKEFEVGHVRNASYSSEQSRGSGYSSAGNSHSRQSSLGSELPGHYRSPSTGSSMSEGGKERRRKIDEALKDRKVESTRVDADEVIDELMKDFHVDETAETSGLQLFVAKDGTTALGSKDIKNRMTAGAFEQVVIDHR